MFTSLAFWNAAAPTKPDHGGDWSVSLYNATVLVILLAGSIVAIWHDPLMLFAADFPLVIVSP